MIIISSLNVKRAFLYLFDLRNKLISRENNILREKDIIMAKLIIKTVLILTLIVSILFVLVQANEIINKRNETIKINKITLSIYFESRCPYSKKFHLEQLKPTFNLLSDHINLDLIPYGNAKFVGPNKIECQHGEKECETNRLMACVNKYGKKYMKDIVATIGCLFSTPSDEIYCIRGYLPGADYDTVMKCKESNESMEMMKEFDERSEHIDYVPWIEINGDHEDDMQEDCQYNLFSTLCDMFSGDDQPKVCRSKYMKKLTSGKGLEHKKKKDFI